MKLSGSSAASAVGSAGKKAAAPSVGALTFKSTPKKAIEGMDGETFTILKNSLLKNMQKHTAVLNSSTTGVIIKLQKAEKTLEIKGGYNGDLNHSSAKLGSEAKDISDVLKGGPAEGLLQ